MKKTITLIKRTEEPIEVEVEFPIYRKHDVSGDDYETVIYSRIIERSNVSITKRLRYGNASTEWTVEIDPEYRLNGDQDYALGRGEYESSAEEFNVVLAELRQVIAEL